MFSICKLAQTWCHAADHNDTRRGCSETPADLADLSIVASGFDRMLSERLIPANSQGECFPA
jgi:hypothetical protein